MEADDERRATARSRWLGEVAAALGEAERLAPMLARWRPQLLEAIILRSRIIAARAEVDALRRSGMDAANATEIEPFRTDRHAPKPRADPAP